MAPSRAYFAIKESIYAFTVLENFKVVSKKW